MNENILKQLREPELIRQLCDRLSRLEVTEPVTLMEVCGTHTMAIHRMGLPSRLPENLRLLSGPGCPVCVTPGSYLDKAFDMAHEHGVTLTTFGDMMRVPGSKGNLTQLRSEGYPVEVVYSPLGALDMARNDPGRNVVFLAVGFETTSPVIAETIRMARRENITNFTALCATKLVMPALEILVNDPELSVDGFILPGHVSVVLGTEPYRIITDTYKRACVITGFEPYDVIQGLFMLVSQIERKSYSVEIQYSRTVKPEGNARARESMFEVFTPSDSAWRGFGILPMSGLAVSDEYADFDAERRFPVDTEPVPEPKGCLCGDVLRGKITPRECPLFQQVCTPQNPVGPCMVSSEGTCAAYYRYSRSLTSQG